MEEIKSREQRMKDHNIRQKNLAKTIGQNLSLYICILIPVLLVGLIWTDASLPKIGWGLLGDAILTVALFVIGERSMLQLGVTGGKLDDEYLDTRKKYRSLVDEVKEAGVLLLDPFCDWQIDTELVKAKKTRCRRAGIKYEEYCEKYADKTFEELKEILGLEKATQINEINKLHPIELNSDLLMTEGYGSRKRRDVPEGAEQYIAKKKYGKMGLLISILTAVFVVGVTLTITQDVTIARVLYTVFKLIALLYRMAKGYNNGAKAYNTIEVAHLNAKIEYLTEYLEFIKKKIYLQIADEYPEIKTFALESENSIEGVTEENEIQGQQSIQEPTAGGDGGGQLDGLAEPDCLRAQPGGS